MTDLEADDDAKWKSQGEDSIFLKMYKEIKMGLFNLVSTLLTQDHFRIELRILLIFIETLQILHYYFEKPLFVLWKQTDSVDIISKITSYTTIAPIIIQLDWQIYKIFFWVFVGVSVILLLLVAIILYSLKRKITGQEGLTKFLKIMTDIICSVGYLPLLDIYLHVFYCEKKGEIWQHRTYPEMQCYTGESSSYTLVGGILAAIIFFYTSIMTFINFESRYISQNCFTKTSGRGDVLFVFYKTICAVLLKVFVDDEYQVILIVVMSIFSVSLFVLFNFNIYYNNDTISKIITTMYSINMWAVLMLIMAYITKDYDFSYSIFLFLLGIPIIFYIIVTRIEQKYDILLLNTNNYKSITMCQNQLMYLTKLLSNYNKNPQVKTILNGFLDYHRTICNMEDCSSKTRVMKTTNFSKQLRTEGESETLITIIAVIQSLYYQGLQKFPNSTRLRILYSLYLCDIIRSKQQAIQELNNAQLEIPSFDESFIIYRYQAIIENELISGGSGKGNSGQNESVNELSIQNYLNACRINIEKSAVHHMEFWSQLQDQTPDLGKLSDLGFKINILNKKVDEFYNKLIQLTHCMPAIMRYYAKFLMQILHDKEKGNLILEKMMYQNTKGMNNLIDMENEHKPTLFISAEDDSFCQVKNANLACQSVLGFSKIELMNRNIKVAMPNLYAQYHNSFIYNYLNTLDPRVLGIERILPAKSKQDYIYAIQVYVRNVPSLIHGLQFSGQFYIDKVLSQTCFIIIDMDGKIQNISTQAIDIFDITSKKLEKTPYSILDICPEFYENNEEKTVRQDIVSKHGIKLECQNLKVRKRPIKFQAQIKAENLIFRVIGQQGYLLRIEKIKEQLTEEQEQKMIINDRNLTQHMGIVYDIDTRTYKGQLEYGPPINAQVLLSGQDFSASRYGMTELDKSRLGKTMTSNKDNINGDTIRTTSDNQDDDNKTQGAADGEDEEKVDPKYGEKIRTIRLIGAKFIDVEDLKREEEQVIEDLAEEEEYNNANQGINFINGELEEESKGFYMQKVLMKKQLFLDFIQKSKFLRIKSVQNLKLYSIFILIIMYLLSLLNYFIVLDVLNQSSDRYKLISDSYRQVSDGQTILSKFLEIYGHNKFNNTAVNNTHIEEQKDEIVFALNDLESIQKVIQLSNLEIKEEHKEIFQNNVVPMRFKINNEYEVIKFDLNEATQQIITKVNSLVSKGINEYDPQKNVDFDFLQYNLFNDYYIYHVKSSEYYVEELETWADEKQIVFIYLLVIAIVFTVIGYLFIIPFYFFIMESQKEVLTLFLDIPQGKIKQLQKQCEEFAKSSQQGNDEEIGSEDKLVQEVQDDADEQTIGRGKGKKRKKYRLAFKNNKIFFLPFFLCSVVFLAYFILSFSLSQDISNKFIVFIKEMHYTNKAESYFGFSNNALRQLLIDENYTVLNGQSVQKYTNSSILEMYNITSGIQSEYTNNIQDHQESYLEAFQDVMVKDRDQNPCNILVERKNVSYTNCEEFMESSILQGFSVALARHFEHFRQVLAEFEYNKEFNSDLVNNGDLFNSLKVTEMETMQKTYISNLFRFLIQKFEESINDSYDNNNGTKVTLLIATLVLLLMFYLILWIPLISNINQEVTRIRSMITMIPLEICNNTPAIKNLLASYITHNFQQ